MHLWQPQIISFHIIFALNILKTKEIVWRAPCCTCTCCLPRSVSATPKQLTQKQEIKATKEQELCNQLSHPAGIRRVQVSCKEGDGFAPLPSSCPGSEIIVTITIVTRTASYCLRQTFGNLTVFARPSRETRAVPAGLPSVQPCSVGAR